eukprot:1376525-Amphidinium_carterae.1
MAAVTQHGRALHYAAEECKADSAIVLAAVKQNCMALQYAAEECKSIWVLVCFRAACVVHPITFACQRLDWSAW